jgi:hypothetical protein
MQPKQKQNRKATPWTIEPNARRFHYWRGFIVGGIVAGGLMFIIMANIVIYVAR